MSGKISNDFKSVAKDLAAYIKDRAAIEGKSSSLGTNYFIGGLRAECDSFFGVEVGFSNGSGLQMLRDLQEPSPGYFKAWMEKRFVAVEQTKNTKLEWAETEEDLLKVIADIPQTHPCPNEDTTTEEHQEWQTNLVRDLMLNAEGFFNDDGGPQNKLIGWIGCLWIDHKEELKNSCDNLPGNLEDYDLDGSFVCDEGLLLSMIDGAEIELTRQESYLRNIKDLDPEVLNLCIALNRLPGIRTTESCCGHGKDSFHIFFDAQDQKDIAPVIYFSDGCHTDHVGWQVNATADCAMRFRGFILHGPVGAFAASEDMAKQIHEFIDTNKHKHGLLSSSDAEMCITHKRPIAEDVREI